MRKGERVRGGGGRWGRGGKRERERERGRERGREREREGERKKIAHVWQIIRDKVTGTYVTLIDLGI